MELVYPKHTKLNDSEKSNINYSSFPDSNSGCMGDTIYHFRFRSKSVSLKNCEKYIKDYPEHIKPVPNNCYGYVNFRQVRDKSIRRGYFQKSVVILSVWPFVKLFYQIVKLVSEIYFQDGEVGLEAACHNIEKWMPPIAGSTINLPLLGVVIQTQLPVHLETSTINPDSTKQHMNNKTNDKPEMIGSKTIGPIKIRASFIEQLEKNNELSVRNGQMESICLIDSPINLDCYGALGSVINQLQLLWELVLTNQPLVVIAVSPTISSMIVHSLVTSIAPLPFSEDHRPFFTIHDSEFKDFTAHSQSPPQVILGITNPFFVKALSHWPNILKVIDVKSGNNGMSRDKNLKNPSYLQRQDDIKPGLYSTNKPFLQTDKSFIKSIQKGLKIERPESVQSEIIRKFFLELTQSFIYPLERYVASLMPLKREISAFRNPPPIKKFNMDDFLKSLENNGPQLTSGIKGDWIGLYKLFFSSPNFVTWFSHRHHKIAVKLIQVHTEVLCRTDLTQWIRNKPEVELVDLIIQINSKMKETKKYHIPITEEQTQKLHGHITTIMSGLPPDLRETLQLTYSPPSFSI